MPGPDGDPGDAIASLVDTLATDPRFVHRHRDPPTAAVHGVPDDGLCDELGSMPELWSHQAAAIDALRAGTSVVLSTPTGSGKSLCYQVPALEAAAAGGCTLMVFPTKALAHDQLHALAARAHRRGSPSPRMTVTALRRNVHG